MIKELDIDLLITFFGFYGTSVNGRTRVQKDVCILKHDAGIPFNFEFESNYYGPFSSELTDIMDTLIAAGLLQETIKPLSLGILRYDYALTAEGKRMFLAIEKKLSQKKSPILRKQKTKIAVLRAKSISEVTALAKKCSGIQSSI